MSDKNVDPENETNTLIAARKYLQAGLSVIPIKTDGSKQPAFSELPRIPNPNQPDRMKTTWEPFQERLPTDDEIRKWFGGHHPHGIALVCGPVSKGTECLDLDLREVAEEFLAVVEEDYPDLLAKLSQEETPNGVHLWYCTEVIEGNQKLASRPDGFDAKTGRAKSKTLIETRGEGGYAVVAGSPLAVHESKKPYRHIGGPTLANITTITAAERDYLFRLARSFHHEEKPQEESTPKFTPQRQANDGPNPVDEYDLHGPPFSDLILDAKFFRPGKDNGLVRRPDKERGCSGTVGYCRGKKGEPLLKVFSSNWSPFQGGGCYGRFNVLRLTQFGGDGKKAMKFICEQGLGPPSKQNGKQTSNKSKLVAKTDGDSLANNTTENEKGLATTQLSSITPEPIRWLVPNVIPLGKLILIAGDGGHGKTTVTLGLAASITKGRPAFGRDDYKPDGPAEVLIISCEDDFADTVVPRLLAAQADLTKISKVDGLPQKAGKPTPFSLAHYKQLGEQLERHPNIKLVVIDPAGAYIGAAGVDDHKDSDLRGLLGPLAEMAAHRRVTILLIKHLTKGATTKAVHKVSGSAGYVNAVRAAFLLAPKPGDDDLKLLLPLKFNIGPKPKGMAFRLEALDRDSCDVILDKFPQLSSDDRERLASQLFLPAWEDAGDIDADTAMVEQPRERTTRVKECAGWLLTFMGTYAWPDGELKEACEDKGFTKDNFWKAKTMQRQEGKLHSRPAGPGKVWWNWLGTKENRPVDRPNPYVSPLAQTQETQETQETFQTQERPPESGQLRLFKDTLPDSGGLS